MTTYELALNEFRDASAAVRRAFGAVAEAREMQIIADSQHKTASNSHAEAVARLERADVALQAAREAPKAAPAGEVYDATGEAPATAASITTQPGVSARVTQADIDAIEPRANGTIDAQAAGLGIG